MISLCSSLITRTPTISQQQQQLILIFEETNEEDEVCEGLIHLEYEEETQPELPYYEEDISILVQTDGQHSRHIVQSFWRSFQANITLIMAVIFILGLLVIGRVYFDLNTVEACKVWMHKNYNIPRNVKILQAFGLSIQSILIFTWFPACISMLWGFQNFKKNYLFYLLAIQLVIGSITCVYRIMIIGKVPTTFVGYNNYRLVEIRQTYLNSALGLD